MMSPYEGERIFEAEMVRLHQCDRTLYSCAPTTARDAMAPRLSWRQWLAAVLNAKPTPTAAPADTTAKVNL